MIKNNQQIEIDVEDRVAAALEKLAKQPQRDLRLECVVTGERYDIEDIRIDADGQTITVFFVAEGLLRERFDAGVKLLANFGTEAFLFTGIEVRFFNTESDPVALQLAKPERVYVSNRREATRIRLVRGMRALVQVQIYAGRNPVDALLTNLSLGGCGIEIELATGMLMQRGQEVAAMYIEFPNGTRASLPAIVRHVQTTDRDGYAYVGFEFPEHNRTKQQNLPIWLRELEREITFRSGRSKSHLLQPSELFLGSDNSQVAVRLDRQSQSMRLRNTPIQAGLRRIAQTLGTAAIDLRHGDPMPIDRLRDCADSLCQMVNEDRTEFLYALCCLHEQPPLIQHCIAVAGRLIDLVGTESTMAPHLSEIAFSALVHDLGNIVHVGPPTPSDDPLITDPGQRDDSHLELLDALGPAGSFVATGIRRAIIESLNATPQTAAAQASSSAVDTLAQAADVVDRVDVMYRGIGNHDPQPPMVIFRTLYQRYDEKDRHWLKRYIQCQGPYPIGTLVQFSTGFLGWVLELGSDGQPSRVRVVRNVGNPRRLDQILGRADFSQIGEIKRAVLPQRFGLLPY